VIDFARPFEASYHPARAYLLQKVVYGLLAFDVWLTMISHGGRYGMASFNVAHFAWIDRALPLPNAATYLALLSLTGLCSLQLVLFRMQRWLKLLVFALYTFSWLWSLLDSYQHHYLLSWLLLWAAFVPEVSSRQARAVDAVLVAGIGVPMTAITCAIVYGFTGLAKSEPDFRAGYVLERLSHSRPIGSAQPGELDPLRDLVISTLGVDARTAWTLLACSLIALQWSISAGYLASITRDERPARLTQWLSALGGLGALSFHAFAELTEMFDIGWFSYYMLAVALALLSPARWAARVAAALAWPEYVLSKRWEALRPLPLRRAALILVSVAACIVIIGSRVGLPGVQAASAFFACMVLGWGTLLARKASAAVAVRFAGAAIACSGLCWLALTQSEVRFDYYRRTAGELLTLGELEPALAAYREAERYAPPGKSRRNRIEAIEAMLRAGARGK
jgi:hypothetical protein